MASVQDIKRRLRSVRNTRKITKAMELVAGARLRRAEARIEAFRASRAERLAVASPRCAAHLKSVDPRIEIVDPTTLLAQI